MKRTDFEKYMRGFETALDQRVPPEIPFVVRVDGRAFTQLIGSGDFMRPFDESITDMMCYAMRWVMQSSGFQINFAYTQSDEISFLISRLDNTYNRKISKILSVIPSMVSSIVSETMQNTCSFDARISLLPSESAVVDYFKWRRADAIRNSKNSFYYYSFLNHFMTGDVGAADEFSKLPDRAEIMATWKDGLGTYEDVSPMNRFGSHIYWHQTVKQGFNPKTKKMVQVIRKQVRHDPAENADFMEAVLLEKTT